MDTSGALPCLHKLHENDEKKVDSTKHKHTPEKTLETNFTDEENGTADTDHTKRKRLAAPDKHNANPRHSPGLHLKGKVKLISDADSPTLIDVIGSKPHGPAEDTRIVSYKKADASDTN